MAEKKTIRFIADKVKLVGPKVDGGFTVTFEVGEYEWPKIKDLPDLNGKIIVVEVKEE